MISYSKIVQNYIWQSLSIMAKCVRTGAKVLK